MVEFTSTPQWKSGTRVADFLDKFFTARGWFIWNTTPHEERVLCLGDRHYQHEDTHYFVEYKSGIQTRVTGNVFLETISVDTQNKLGWVYTCRADFIFYATVMNGCILVLKPDELRSKIDYLKTRFRETKTGKNQNGTYNTHGLIVPFNYVKEHLTEQIINIGG